MKKIVKLSIIGLLILGVFSIFSLTVSAADPAAAPSTGFLPTANGPKTGCPDDTTNCGNYTLNDMMSVALIVSNYILGIVGSLALLAFVVGGMMWVLSAGNAELVTRGKQTIIGAVIGLVIVFTSFMIIQLVYASLGLGWKGESSFPKPTTQINPTNP